MARLTIPDLAGKVFLVTGASTGMARRSLSPWLTKALRSRSISTPAPTRPNMSPMSSGITAAPRFSSPAT